jgi:hypothetical protein
LHRYIQEIGPEHFTEKAAFRKEAARGAANLVEYLDSTAGAYTRPLFSSTSAVSDIKDTVNIP